MCVQAHPGVVPLGVQQGDGEGSCQVGRVEYVSEREPAFPQKPEQTQELQTSSPTVLEVTEAVRS